MTSIVQSSQTADETLLAVFGKTCALHIYPFDDFGLLCIKDDTAESDSPFGNAWVISLGFCTALVATIPFAYLNLDDNIQVQMAAFLGLVLVVIEWVVQFHAHGFDWSLLPPLTSDQTGVFGSVLFNFAFITTIPSWVNEKHVSVDIGSSIWLSTSFGSTIFVVVGLFGALSYRFREEDLLTVLVDDPNAFPITKTCVYLYPLIALLTSIPIFSIIVRYNLLESHLCNDVRWANFWSVVAPWLGASFFYSGDLLNNIVNWAGLITAAPLNFILPCFFYIRSQRLHLLDHRDFQPLLVDDDTSNKSKHIFHALPVSWWGVAIAYGVLGLVVILNLLAIVVEVWPSSSSAPPSPPPHSQHHMTGI
eukprot:c4141_g1_i2.p1 GENE.c4141_g1_i2~~c4141_g1_i2.p1  ORF type:complete len:363 (+),score=60.92 c4141_g1_i2:573-1661(+)